MPILQVQCKFFVLLALLNIGGCKNNSATLSDENLRQNSYQKEISKNSSPEKYHWPSPCGINLEADLKASKIMDRGLTPSDIIKSRKGKPIIKGDIPGVYTHEGHIGNFDYLEVVYGNIETPDDPMPLVVMLHSRGSRPVIPQNFFKNTKKVRLFIPRANKKLGRGFSWLATFSKTANQKLFVASLTERTKELVRAVIMFKNLRQTVGKPVIMGFSQGGILSWTIAVNYPDFFKTAFIIAGWIPDVLIPKIKKTGVAYPEIYALHGALDKIVPASYGERTITLLNRAGIKTTWIVYPDAAHKITKPMRKQILLWTTDLL